MRCCLGDRSLKDKLGNGDARFTRSLKRMKELKLVGVPQIALDPEARAREEFPGADLDGNGFISFNEMKQLLFKLNAYLPTKEMKRLFHEADLNGDGELNLEEFQSLFSKADHREMMIRLFKETDQLVNGYVSAQNLFEFYKKTAPEDEISGWKPPTLDECAQIVATYVASGNPKKKLLDSHGKPAMGLFHFQQLLSDPDANHICNPDRVFRVYQDMTRPLSHYYISSSHNSYLEGSQTTGTSTPAAIKRALELGVRVIELDVWDGSSEPIVNHGHTFCKPTTFKGCIEAVNTFAFVASSYPVILTIENHCTKKFQEKMARILTSVLGDKLYRFQQSNVEREKLFRGPDEWVSPEDLLEKVVIRDKPKKTKKDDKKAKALQEKSKASSSGKKKGGMEEKDVNEDDLAMERKLRISINLKDVEEESRKQKKSGWFSSSASSKGNKDSSKPADSRKKSAVPQLSTSDESSGRSLGVSFDLSNGTSQKSLGVENGSSPPDSKSKLVQTAKLGRGPVDNDSTRSELNDLGYDEDEEEDDFVDDIVEQEGLADVVAAKLEEKKKEFQMSLSGSVRFAVGRLGGVLNDNNLKELLKEPPTQEKLTNSVQQLLELVYIKNVKIKFREDKVSKRVSIKSITSSSMTASSSSMGISSSSLSSNPPQPDEYKSIHFVYPEWRSSSSIAEPKMLRLVKPGPRVAALSTYAKHHLVRCYPAGTRVDSGNYEPSPAWNAGIQIVALNYQTNGKPIWVNQGKFADNGACGWVLKPRAMLEARSCGRDTPEEEQPEEESKRYWDLIPHPNDPPGDRLVITIISAHHLPKPLGVNESRSEIIDPFIEVHINGYGLDEAMFKTKVVNDNGFNPEFNETFTITLKRPELDTILFQVKDKDVFSEDFIAQNCFAVNLVRPGYRTVPLRRADSTPVPDSFLFVHVKWERKAVN